MGGLPNVFPGYQAVTVPENRQKFENAWGRSMPPNAGITIMEMMQAASTAKSRFWSSWVKTPW
jgi:formate dehydrogenase major subunit/formate dehydrogenase alpha subunit